MKKEAQVKEEKKNVIVKTKALAGKAKKGVKAFKFCKKYVYPGILLSFAAVAYAVFDVPIPEKPKPKKKKK